MMNKLLLIFVAFFIGMGSVYCQTKNLYVSAKGSSSNARTIAKPFLKPEDALKAIKKNPVG